jgi:hypothetical protein
MKITVVGDQKQKDKLFREFNKDYSGFMSRYDDPETSIGQSWLVVMLDLCQRWEHILSEYEQKEFQVDLENFSGIIGSEFDLDLEYTEH